MFTGLVEGQGTIQLRCEEGAGTRLVVQIPAPLQSGTAVGDSVAINGCCLTVIDIGPGAWSFQAGPETLLRTNLGDLAVGATVNLERALPVAARLGGHFVQGHIDGCGEVERIVPDGEWVTYWFRIPQALSRYLVSKGSIAVDGVSLTVVAAEAERFSVALIPHTLAVTTLGVRGVGDRVNIETDILAKYVEQLLARPQ